MGHTLKVDLGDRSYDILIHQDTLHRCADYITPLGLGTKGVIITNEIVSQWYLEPIVNSLTRNGFDITVLQVPDGEKTKSIEWLEYCYHKMLEAQCDRHSFVLALGGGVVGDLAGFAAASFMRGIAYIQVPTTLLSQVDSSVGGKTGINLSEGKNLVGAFYQPKLVLIDPSVLKTLAVRELRAGFAEVIKYGVIYDGNFFEYLVNHIESIFKLKRSAINHIISTSCKLKAKVVAQDERESGLRAILNFGHTAGHAIEALTAYGEIVHGEAVAIGMMVACSLGEQLTGFSNTDTLRVKQLLKQANLPYNVPDYLTNEALIEAMYHDKKVSNSTLRFVLPKSIGTVKIIGNIAEDDLQKALNANRT